MAIDLSVLKIADDGCVSFSIFPQATVIEGPDLLAQKVLICLFTVPGDIATDPAWGGDIRGRLRSVSASNDVGVRRATVGALNKVVADIIVDQPSDPEQRLRALDLSDLVNEGPGAWSMVVAMQTEARTVPLPIRI